ncbi:MAG: hypothetical protein RLZZ316_2433 [Bacteroidota bacterium]|jgi:hypothetical protein
MLVLDGYQIGGKQRFEITTKTVQIEHFVQFLS